MPLARTDQSQLRNGPPAKAYSAKLEGLDWMSPSRRSAAGECRQPRSFRMNRRLTSRPRRDIGLIRLMAHRGSGAGAFCA